METKDKIEWTHLTETLNRFADYFINRAKQNLLQNGSNASGTLTNSIVLNEIIVDDDHFEVTVNLEDYWKYVNGGRGPTKNGGNGIVRRSILEWIRVKNILPVVRKSPTTRKEYLPTVEQLAFLISRKIHREGYEGNNFFDDAKEDATQRFKEAIELSIIEDVEAYIISNIK